MHVPRSSFSRTRASPPLLSDSPTNPPISLGNRPASGRTNLPPMNSSAAASSATSSTTSANLQSIASPSAGLLGSPSSPAQPSINSTSIGQMSPPRDIPGQVAAERSPLPARNANAINSPLQSGNASTGMPITPTASHSYSSGINASSQSTLPPPPIQTLGGRSMEDEAAAFLADPSATEAHFMTQSQKNRGNR